MRVTRDMIDYQLDIANEKLKDTNKKIVVTSRYGYKAIELVDKITTGATDIRSGLTTKEAYDIIYSFNELTYLINREVNK